MSALLLHINGKTICRRCGHGLRTCECKTSTAVFQASPRGAGRVGGGISHAASDTPTQPLKDALDSNSDVNCLIHGERK